MGRVNEQRSEIDRQKEHLARSITEQHFELHPGLDKKYGPIGRVKCEQDAKYHLSYLAEAVALGQPALFADYALWAKLMLEGRGVPADDLVDNLKVIRSVVSDSLSAETAAAALHTIDVAVRELTSSGSEKDSKSNVEEELASWIEKDNPYYELVTEFLNALLSGDRQTGSRIILNAVEQGVPIKDLYLHVFQPSQHEVGRLWQINRLSVAQEHYCTAATQLIMSQLYPYLFSAKKNGKTMIATCVSGDLHEIGVRMIADFFEMEGWDTFYLGANVPVDSVIRMMKEKQASILAVSATMTYHLQAVRDLIEAVRKHEETRHAKVIVGGYPFNIAQDLWKELGADGHAPNAEQAVELASTLIRTV